MNNTFDFKRFRAVIGHDWQFFVRNFGITMIVLTAIPATPWLSKLMFGDDYGVVHMSRWMDIALVTVFSIILAASKIYGKANLPREGVAFAMLPATNLEKFFSMFFYCAIFVPVAVFVGSWIVDTLLSLIPIPIYEGILNPFDIVDLDMLVVFTVVSLWFISALFMLGNMIFKHRKAAKTIAWLMLIVFVFVMLLQALDVLDGIENFFDRMSPIASIWFFVVVLFVADCILFYLTYRRIKNQKY